MVGATVDKEGLGIVREGFVKLLGDADGPQRVDRPFLGFRSWLCCPCCHLAKP